VENIRWSNRRACRAKCGALQILVDGVITYAYSCIDNGDQSYNFQDGCCNLNDIQVDHELPGVKVENSLEYLSHLLSMDDVLCFFQGSSRNFLALKSILDLFCQDTGIKINYLKSCIISHRLLEVSLKILEDDLPFPRKELEVGFKYSRFFLKPDGYKTGDWNHLYNKVRAQISFWGNCLISQVGRLNLVKYILESISVY